MDDIRKLTMQNTTVLCRWARTILLWGMSFTMGIVSAIVGPTLVHLEIVFDTSIETLSGTFFGQGVGQLVGNIICGIVLERPNRLLIFCLSLVVLCITTAAGPWVGNVYGFIALWTIRGVILGIINTAAQPYCIELWQGHWMKDAAVLLLNCFWSVGCTISPLVCRPFLVDLVTILNQASPPNVGNTTTPANDISNLDLLFDQLRANISTEAYASIFYVRQAYVVVIAPGIVMALFALVLFLCEKPIIVIQPKVTVPDKQRSATSSPNDLQHQRLLYVIMALLFIFYFCYSWYEAVMGGYLSPITIKGLFWSAETAALLTMVFWLAHAAGRFFAIFFVSRIKPLIVLMINIVCLLCSLVLMCEMNVLPAGVFWFSAVFVGVGMSTVYPCGILWASSYVQFTVKTAAVLFVGASLGAIIGPSIAGLTFDRLGYLSVVYFTLGIVVMQLLVFIVLTWLFKLHSKANSISVAEETK